MTDITKLAQRARINADCGEHLSPAETMELLEALEKAQQPIVPVSVPDEYVAPVPTPTNLGYEAGWNACRAAMLAAAPHDTTALNSLQSVDSVTGGWIPVSERMPDENAEQQVLACFKGGDISTLYYFEGRWDDAYGIVPIRQDVTHWMSLPAAPQEPILACISKRSQRLS